MASLASLVAACRAAAASAHPEDAVAAVLRDVTEAPGEWGPVFARDVTTADERGVALLHIDDVVTVMHVDLEPGFTSRVHDHGTWAVISVYEGQEDNTFYELRHDRPEVDRVVEVPAPGLIHMAAADIHHIHNPSKVRLRAVHVYGGDLRTTLRASWNLETGVRTPEGGSEGAVPPDQR